MAALEEELVEFQQRSWIAPEEIQYSQQMLTLWREEGKKSLYRECRPAHFTASALVVSPDRTKLLLLFHKKLQIWIQPGGHADGEKNLQLVAQREISEETGLHAMPLGDSLIAVDWHEIPQNAREDAHFHADCTYAFCAEGWDLNVALDEAEAARWLTPEEALTLARDASVHKLIGRFSNVL